MRHCIPLSDRTCLHRMIPFGRVPLRLGRRWRSLRAAVRLPLLVVLLLWAAASSRLDAAVIVLANRSAAPVPVRVASPLAVGHSLSVAPGESRPLFVDGTIQLAIGNQSTGKLWQLDPNTIHFFTGDQAGQVGITQIGFTSHLKAGASQTVDTGQPSWARRIEDKRPRVVIQVKLLVDENEPTRREFWEPKLRRRIEVASALFEQACGVKFEVVGVETWQSDDRLTEFHHSLREFEQDVTPAPAQLAVGFTSQYQLPKGRVHLGGTRGPLRGHILLREWSRHFSESERLELLVHELGHYLCATHSPEGDSVMRPVLGDRRANSVQFRIGFDPVNTLILNLVAEDLRAKRVQGFNDLAPATRLGLRAIYKELVLALPNDPAADHFVRLLVRSGATELADGARQVVQAVVRAAERNRQLPEAAEPGKAARLSGDHLLELYVRAAAQAAARLPKEEGSRAFAVGLGVALDRAGTFDQPGVAHRVRSIYGTIEDDAERTRRLAVLGEPTIHGRADLAQHFVVSAALSLLVGPQAAETMGVFKEVADSRAGGSGFSFADLTADLAGLTLGRAVREGTVSLERLATSFRLPDFMPDTSGQAEGLMAAEFAARYGSIADERFRREREAIVQRIRALPGYQIRVRGAAAPGPADNAQGAE